MCITFFNGPVMPGLVGFGLHCMERCAVLNRVIVHRVIEIKCFLSVPI